MLLLFIHMPPPPDFHPNDFGESSTLDVAFFQATVDILIFPSPIANYKHCLSIRHIDSNSVRLYFTILNFANPLRSSFRSTGRMRKLKPIQSSTRKEIQQELHPNKRKTTLNLSHAMTVELIGLENIVAWR